ncbi:MAG: C1 family peptidase [Desulfosarcinaceae bacterium]
MRMVRKALVIGLLGIFFFIGACGEDVNTDDPSRGEEEETFGMGNEDFDPEAAALLDPLNSARTTSDVSEYLPSRVDYATQLPRVRSQGHTGSCTAWAVGYYGKSYQEAQEEGWDPDENAFSPAYLFSMQCQTYENPYAMDKAWAILHRHGCAKWDTLPFEDLSQSNSSETEAYANLNISAAVHEEARIYRCGSMTNVKGINQVKTALNQGPVVVAIHQFSSPPRNPSPEENFLSFDGSKSEYAGHAILFVGYDDSKFGGGAFKFVNSWGSDWGENGFCWIRYADFGKIVYAAFNYKDIANPDAPDNPDEPDDPDSRPAPPDDVSASDDEGAYVDISWSAVSGAQYYRIYRKAAPSEPGHGYETVGTARQGEYRDYPPPGVAFYYAVVAVNDLGESDHHAGDTDSAGHVDIGSAVGSVLLTPALTWEYNDAEGSHFSVANIDAAATAMEVLVSLFSAGPWDSLGWIEPDEFYVNWGDGSEYTNKKPYVRVRVSSKEGASEPSDPVQVGEDIPSDGEVGKINIMVFDAKPASMLLRWMTDGGHFDYFEIWRYRASDNTDQEWVKLGYVNLDVKDEDDFNYYEDLTPLPGIPYYYALVPVYQGNYGKIYYSNEFKIEADEPNLALSSYQYYYANISAYTEFPNVVVRNDGGADVNGYTIGILAKSWVDGSVSLVATARQTTPLTAGEQQQFDIKGIDIPAEFANGTVYSWGMMVDYDEEIDETYESDNIKWSTDGWYLSSSTTTSLSPSLEKRSVETGLGSTRPYAPKQPGVESPDRQVAEKSAIRETAAPDLIYNGPIEYKRPELCIQHQE